MNEMKEENDCFLCKRLCIFDLPSFAKENFNLLNKYKCQIFEIQGEFPNHLQKSRSYSDFQTMNYLLKGSDPEAAVKQEKLNMDRKLKMLNTWIMEYPKMCIIKKDLNLLDSFFNEINEMNQTQISETKLLNIMRTINIAYTKLVSKYNSQRHHPKYPSQERTNRKSVAYPESYLCKCTQRLGLIQEEKAIIDAPKLIPIEMKRITNCCQKKISQWKEIIKTYSNTEEPMMLCRICEERITVANEEEHTTACICWSEKMKEVTQIDLNLLNIATEITSSIHLIRKKILKEKEKSKNDQLWKNVIKNKYHSKTHLRDIMSDLANKRHKSIRSIGSKEMTEECYSPIETNLRKLNFLKKCSSSTIFQKKNSEYHTDDENREDINSTGVNKKLSMPTYFNTKPPLQINSSQKERTTPNSQYCVESNLSLFSNLSNSPALSINLSSSGNSFSSNDERENSNILKPKVLVISPRKPLFLPISQGLRDMANPLFSFHMNSNIQNKKYLNEESFNIKKEEIDEGTPVDGFSLPSTSVQNTLNHLQLSFPKSLPNTPRTQPQFGYSQQSNHGIISPISIMDNNSVRVVDQKRRSLPEETKIPVYSVTNIQNRELTSQLYLNRSKNIVDDKLMNSENSANNKILLNEEAPKSSLLNLGLNSLNFSDKYSSPSEEESSKNSELPRRLPVTNMKPEYEKSILTQLRIIARAAYNISNLDSKFMDPLLDKIERIDDKYAIKILDCYCHKLKELVANKQRAHSIISSLNIKMGKHHSEKPTVRTSEMPAASPPTRILLPPPALRQIRSFRYQEAEEIMHDFGFSSQFIARKTTPQQPIETPKRKKKQEIPLTDQIIETKSKGKKMNNSKQKPSQPPNLPKTQKSNKVPTQEIKSRTFKVKITSQKKQPIKDNKIKVKINKNMEERKLPKRAKDGSKKLPRDKQTKKVSEQYIYSPNKHSLAKLNLNTTEIIFEVDRKDEETPGTSKRNQINKSPGNSKTLSKFHKISSRKSPQHSKSTFNQPKKTIKHIEDSIQQDFLENTIAKIQLNPPNSQFFELVNRKEEKVINKRDLWVENFKKNKFQSAYKKVFDTQGQENLRNCENTFNSKIFPKYRRRPLEKMNIATAPPLDGNKNCSFINLCSNIQCIMWTTYLC